MRIILIFLLITEVLLAQVPPSIPNQAVARNGKGLTLANLPVKVRFSILDSILNGTTVNSESYEPTTSAQGLFSVNIAMGNSTIGSFSSINWNGNAKFLKVELYTTASGSNNVDLGLQKMISVPYSFYSCESKQYSFTFNSTI